MTVDLRINPNTRMTSDGRTEEQLAADRIRYTVFPTISTKIAYPGCWHGTGIEPEAKPAKLKRELVVPAPRAPLWLRFLALLFAAGVVGAAALSIGAVRHALLSSAPAIAADAVQAVLR